MHAPTPAARLRAALAWLAVLALTALAGSLMAPPSSLPWSRPVLTEAEAERIIAETLRRE